MTQQPTDQPYVPDELPDDVQWGFTRAGLYYVRHHFHWIPVTKGIARQHLATHWPGLDWNVMVKAFNRHRIWIPDETHFSRKDLAPRVKEFHLLFNGRGRVLPFRKGEIPEAGPTGGGFNISITPAMLDTPQALDSLAEAIIEKLRPT